MSEIEHVLDVAKEFNLGKHKASSFIRDDENTMKVRKIMAKEY